MQTSSGQPTAYTTATNTLGYQTAYGSTQQSSQGHTFLPPPTFHPRPAQAGQQPATAAQGPALGSTSAAAQPQPISSQQGIQNLSLASQQMAALQNQMLANSQRVLPSASALPTKPVAAQEGQPRETAPELPQKRLAKKEDANFGLVLPLHKVKKLIKAEGDVKAVSGEGAYAIARATELFIEELVQRAYQQSTAGNKALDSLEYDDISGTVKKWAACDFLRDIVPETLTLEELTALVERQSKASGAKLS